MEVYDIYCMSLFMVLRSLLIIIQVGLPYLRARAQDYFEALGGGVDHEVFDENAQSRQARALSEEVRGFITVTRARL